MSQANAQPHAHAPLPLWKTLLFSLIPLLALGLVGEAAIRIYRGELLSLDSKRSWRLSLLSSGYPTVYDAQLGYIPRPGFAGADNVWGTTVTIDANGLRNNGPATPVGTGTILALGDSFTFGDEVNDAQTWPAHLEQLLGTRVLNAGVFGYGLDQAALRLEALLPLHAPDTVILAVVPDDVNRSELSSRYAWKPYFDIRDETLVLRNVPVPTGYRAQTVKEMLGYSHLLDFILSRVLPVWWLVSSETIRAHDRGPAVAALLIDRMHALSTRHDFELLLVILDEGGRNAHAELLAPMLQRAKHLGVGVLDLLPQLRALEADPAIRAQWRAPNNHLSSAGNRWVASQIKVRLAKIAANASR